MIPKEKYRLILEQFLKYEKAKKCWNSMLKRMNGKYKEYLTNYKSFNFEEFDFSKTKKGTSNWQVLNYSTDYMHITVKKDNLIFHLKVFDRDLENIATRTDFSFFKYIDSDRLVVFEVEDENTKQFKILDYRINKTEKGYTNIFTEWVQQPNYGFDKVEYKTELTEEDFNSFYNKGLEV